MIKQNFKELIPSIILGFTLIYTTVVLISNGYSPGTQLMMGYLMSGISLTFFFFNQRIYRYALGITLLAGTFNLVAFRITTQEFGFYFSAKIGIAFSVGVEYYALMILIIYAIVYQQKLKQFLSVKGAFT